jgi:adenylate cyclase
MSLFDELKRRNVIRVGAAYAIAAWVIAQIAEFAFENFGAPDWVLKSVVVILLLGLPVALIFAWAFELTPEGIRLEKQVDRSQSIVSETGRKLDRMIIGVLVVALAWFAWDKFYAASEQIPETAVQEVMVNEPADKSVAVLPFVAMSSGDDDEYFADGLTEEILNSLAQLPELLVTARTSAFSFKGQDIPVQEIAAALGVKHIVEGSVRRSGDRLRVTAQLIRAHDGFHLWSDNYDSSSTDTIAVQENIAEKIAAALNVILDEKKREAMRDAGLRDAEAFTIYQKGLDMFDRSHGEIEQIDGLRQANVFFEQVIQRVPDFAQVYLDHSDLYVHILSEESSVAGSVLITGEETAVAYAAAIADYEAALRFAQSPVVRLMTDVDLAFVSGNWRGLGRKLDQATRDPGCYEGNWTEIVGNVFGHSKQLLELSRKLLACDPRRSLSWFNTARAALYSGDKEEALRLAREGTSIAPGGWLSFQLAVSLTANGHHDEAHQVINDRVEDDYLLPAFHAMVSAHQGDRDSFDESFSPFKSEHPNDYYWLLIMSAWIGDREQANHFAAKIDTHPFGSVTLSMISTWCHCGAPFELSATPNFAARLEGSGLTWPPVSALDFPLKNW